MPASPATPPAAACQVLLVEQADLASATSSASTKLIHGGLRYLEYYEFRLVREALIEREVLLRGGAAHHLAADLRAAAQPALRPAWMVRLGLFLYDHLGGRKLLPASARSICARDPAGAPLKPGFAPRLQLFRLLGRRLPPGRAQRLDAARARRRDPAPAPAASAPRRDGDGWLAELEDAAAADAGRSRARALVNAAGPWVVEFLADGLGLDTRQARAAGQGQPHRRAAGCIDGDHAYILQNDDRRIVFAIPYERRLHADRHHRPALRRRSRRGARSRRSETDYLCEVVNRYFAQQIAPADVVWTYAGVRPLYDDASADASAVTRDYVLELDAGYGRAPLLSVFGGKITTYRKLAEHALEKLQPRDASRSGRPGRRGAAARRRHPRRGFRRASSPAPRRAHPGCRGTAGARWRAPTARGRRGSLGGASGSPISASISATTSTRPRSTISPPGMGAHRRRRAVAPLQARPACRRRHGGRRSRPGSSEQPARRARRGGR